LSDNEESLTFNLFKSKNYNCFYGILEYCISDLNFGVDTQDNIKEEVLKPIKDKLDDILSSDIFQELKDAEKHTLENCERLIQQKLSNEKSHYIPAERNLISIFSASMFAFLSSGLTIPKYVIDFGNQFELARNKIKNLDLLNNKYVYENNENKIYFSKTKSLLDKSSSGIQSILPMFLVIKYLNINQSTNIIIEEPEQNLFPKAQKETVEFIIGNINDDNALFMMTHSPYILTSLNNLILANEVKEQKGLDAINGIVEEKHCVAFEDVSAYSLVDGKSIDIMDKEDRLIGVNVIDSISDEVSYAFDTLLSKLD
jgi:hypothetical protein